MSRKIALCIFEDRVSDEQAVRVAISSILARSTLGRVLAFLPNASDALRAWSMRYERVTLFNTRPTGAYGWSAKPYVLLAALAEGFDEAWWIDTDIVAVDDFVVRYSEISLETLLITEEALAADYEDHGLRARLWRFPLGRHFGFALNSGVIRAGQAHRSLLESWVALVNHPDFTAAQKLPWHECPPHMHSDQDLLTALLCSEAFKSVSVRVLTRGHDIIQYFGPTGYTTGERLLNMFGTRPAFIHSQGYKPWRPSWKLVGSRSARAFGQLMLDCSPYSREAQRYRAATELPLEWTEPVSFAGRCTRALGFGSRTLTGLPVALVADMREKVQSALNRKRGGST